MFFIFKVILVLALVFVVIGFGANRLQRFLMYVPDTMRVSPQSVDLQGVNEVTFKTGDGETIFAWWSKAEAGKPTLLYFHGNAGSLASRSERIRFYQKAGIGLFMMTYRGYGGSSGKPSEKANVADGKQAYEVLRAANVPAGQIVVYGESLGTGVAVQVAAQKPVAGVVLDAPYTSMVALAELHYPILPSRFFMTDRYRSIAHIKKVAAPLLIVHGARDVTVPASMGQALYRAAPQPKQIEIFDDAGHSDHYAFGAGEKIVAWLEILAPTKSGAPPHLEQVGQ